MFHISRWKRPTIASALSGLALSVALASQPLTSQALAAGIEIPRGAIVETLQENGFAVFSIKPKQLGRFRDRYSPAGCWPR